MQNILYARLIYDHVLALKGTNMYTRVLDKGIISSNSLIFPSDPI